MPVVPTYVVAWFCKVLYQSEVQDLWVPDHFVVTLVGHHSVTAIAAAFSDCNVSHSRNRWGGGDKSWESISLFSVGIQIYMWNQ